jgi:PmbA protein
VDYLDLAKDVTARAKAKGADECDCLIEVGSTLSVTVRSGEVESIERAAFKGLGIRFFTEKKLGFGFTTDLSPGSLDDLLQQCADFALVSTADPVAAIPEVLVPAADCDLEIFDPAIDSVPMSDKVDLVLTCEQAAFDFDSKIKNTYGTAYEDARVKVILATMSSDPVAYEGTHFEIGCLPVAEENGEKRIGIWYSPRRFFSDLEPPADVGKAAARRAVDMLGAKPVKTQKASVVFGPLTGIEFVRSIFSALDGENELKGTTFLKGKLNERVGSEHVSFVDDGRMPRKVGSRPFDGEGAATRNTVGIDKGILSAHFYDSRSARKAGTETTGNASRTYGSIPSVGANNFYLAPGEASAEDVIAGVENGLLVTRLLGFGVNITTGDYSRGAEGLWVRDGRIEGPVSGITIAGNMLDMLRNIERVGSDLHFFGQFGSPTYAISEMTIAGE